jgi:hypothetical protein
MNDDDSIKFVSFDGFEKILRSLVEVRNFFVHVLAEQLLSFGKPSRGSDFVIAEVHPLFLPAKNKIKFF